MAYAGETLDGRSREERVEQRQKMFRPECAVGVSPDGQRRFATDRAIGGVRFHVATIILAGAKAQVTGRRCAASRGRLDAIGDGWSLLIVRDAFDGLRRFGEFQKSLGLAKNILSARLRNLVAHGVMEAVPASDGGAHQEYALTEKGRGLFPLLVALRQWGEDYFFDPEEPHVVLVDKTAGLPVRKLEPRAQDGRLLGPGDAVVRLPARDR
jgi:DNA-binding HxlR family transcriptional regulator